MTPVSSYWLWQSVLILRHSPRADSYNFLNKVAHKLLRKVLSWVGSFRSVGPNNKHIFGCQLQIVCYDSILAFTSSSLTTRHWKRIAPQTPSAFHSSDALVSCVYAWHYLLQCCTIMPWLDILVRVCQWGRKVLCHKFLQHHLYCWMPGLNEYPTWRDQV